MPSGSPTQEKLDAYGEEVAKRQAQATTNNSPGSAAAMSRSSQDPEFPPGNPLFWLSAITTFLEPEPITPTGSNVSNLDRRGKRHRKEASGTAGARSSKREGGSRSSSRSRSRSRDPGYSRKEKSLGRLCENFLKRYNSPSTKTVSLDKAAVELGVERRRIYDIVNVFESLGIVERLAKNSYVWLGLQRMHVAVEDLQRNGVTDDPSMSGTQRKAKSLGLLTQHFLLLFLAETEEIIPLEDAAKTLLGEEASDPGKLKTKVRRLYDIANILASLGLISKTSVIDGDVRKPAFVWSFRERNKSGVKRAAAGGAGSGSAGGRSAKRARAGTSGQREPIGDEKAEPSSDDRPAEEAAPTSASSASVAAAVPTSRTARSTARANDQGNAEGTSRNPRSLPCASRQNRAKDSPSSSSSLSMAPPRLAQLPPRIDAYSQHSTNDIERGTRAVLRARTDDSHGRPHPLLQSIRDTSKPTIQAGGY